MAFSDFVLSVSVFAIVSLFLLTPDPVVGSRGSTLYLCSSSRCLFCLALVPGVSYSSVIFLLADAALC